MLNNVFLFTSYIYYLSFSFVACIVLLPCGCLYDGIKFCIFDDSTNRRLDESTTRHAFDDSTIRRSDGSTARHSTIRPVDNKASDDSTIWRFDNKAFDDSTTRRVDNKALDDSTIRQQGIRLFDESTTRVRVPTVNSYNSTLKLNGNAVLYVKCVVGYHFCIPDRSGQWESVSDLPFPVETQCTVQGNGLRISLFSHRTRHHYDIVIIRKRRNSTSFCELEQIYWATIPLLPQKFAGFRYLAVCIEMASMGYCVQSFKAKGVLHLLKFRQLQGAFIFVQ